MNAESVARRRWRYWWPLALLCLLSAGRWMLEDAVPAAAPTAGTEALGCGFVGLLAIAEAWRGRREPLAAGVFLQSAIAGAMLLGGPAVVVLAGVRGFDVTALTMALALVPVVVTVAGSAFGRVHAESLAGRLWPGIAAVTGLLLLLPVPSLSAVTKDVLLVLAPLMTGIGAAWLRAREGDTAWRFAAAMAGATLMFAVAALVHPTAHVGALWVPVGVNTVLAGLVVLALLRVGAVRWSAQFEIVPLAVVLEGLYFVRPKLDTRMVAGIGLLLVASVFLLLPPKAEEASDLDLYVLGGEKK